PSEGARYLAPEQCSRCLAGPRQPRRREDAPSEAEGERERRRSACLDEHALAALCVFHGAPRNRRGSVRAHLDDQARHHGRLTRRYRGDLRALALGLYVPLVVGHGVVRRNAGAHGSFACAMARPRRRATQSHSPRENSRAVANGCGARSGKAPLTRPPRAPQNLGWRPIPSSRKLRPAAHGSRRATCPAIPRSCGSPEDASGWGRTSTTPRRRRSTTSRWTVSGWIATWSRTRTSLASCGRRATSRSPSVRSTPVTIRASPRSSWSPAPRSSESPTGP